ncbi:MAG: hypothetical protein ACKVX7_12145 [Planctomycetota bacterium]
MWTRAMLLAAMVVGGVGTVTAQEDCASAVLLLDGTYTIPFPGATTDGSPASCGQAFDDIWILWPATTTGTYEFSTCGTMGMDTVIVVYDATFCPPVLELGCNDDYAPCGVASRVIFSAVTGTIYYLRIGFLAPGATGLLTFSIGPFSPCPDITSLACAGDCGTGEVTLTWDPLGGGATSILIERDDVLIATLSPSATSFVDLPTTGLHEYSVTVNCGGSPSTSATCSMFALTGVPSNIVLALEAPSLIDSVTAVENALTSLGKDFITVTDIAQIPCKDSDTLIWSLTGTFPENFPLTPAVGQYYYDHVVAGGPVYHEGGDTWGFDPETVFELVDGVEDGTATDGDDSFTGMIGVGDFVGFDAPYNQDQVGNDWTDQLLPATTDIAGANSSVIWTNDGVPTYNTGVFYDTDSGFGKVIAQSWEIGGYGATIADVVNEISYKTQGNCVRVSVFTVALDSDQDSVSLGWTFAAALAAPQIVTIWRKVAGGAYAILPDYTVLCPIIGPYGLIDTPPSAGEYCYRIRSCSVVIEECIVFKYRFKRGDANGDGALNIGDGVFTLDTLFGGGPLSLCQDAADSNDDNDVDIGDVIYTLSYLFSGGAPPPAPFPNCGRDCAIPNLGCDSYGVCP